MLPRLTPFIPTPIKNNRISTLRVTIQVSALPITSALRGLTTDIIVGFPQETEEEFLKSEEVIPEFAFHRVHLFPFSPRPGTKAFTMEGRPGREAVSRRMNRMEDAARQGQRRFLEMMAGHPTSVLIERETAPGSFTGYTPEYLRVTLSGHYELNTVVPVTVDDGLQAMEVKEI